MDDILELDADILDEFIADALEQIKNGYKLLLSLETDAKKTEVINELYRLFHSLKGTTGFLNLSQISHLAHISEDIISRSTDSQTQIPAKGLDLIGTVLETFEGWLIDLQAAANADNNFKTNNLKPEFFSGYNKLVEQITDFINAPQVDDEKVIPADQRLGDLLVISGAIRKNDLEDIIEETRDTPHKLGEVLIERKKVKVTDIAQALRRQQAYVHPITPGKSSNKKKGDDVVRIPYTLIDSMHTIIDSLHTEITEVVAAKPEQDSEKMFNLKNQLGKLKDLSYEMRLVPLKSLFNKMRHMTSHLARKTSKEVNFIVNDGQLLINRKAIDGLSVSIIHLLRNAIDHGIEDRAARTELGKKPIGTIQLRAWQVDNYLVISIEDDGHGINLEKIRQKAIKKGMITIDEYISAHDLLDMMFKPGFSTQDSSDEISGRGIGLDVVEFNIRHLNGEVKVHTQPGRGTRIDITVPEQSKDTFGLICKSSGMWLAIESKYIQSTEYIEHKGLIVKHQNCLRFRDKPLINSAELLSLPPSEPRFIVWLKDGQGGLLVDELHSTDRLITRSLAVKLEPNLAVRSGILLDSNQIGFLLDGGYLFKHHLKRAPADLAINRGLEAS